VIGAEGNIASITIHRGARQIGGSVTEIAIGDTKVFIDIGENLPGSSVELPQINGLTVGDGKGSALFLSHYHNDHIGELKNVLEEVTVFVGKTAKAIQMNLVKRVDPACLFAYERINTFIPLDRVKIGPITIIPLMIDHSAFDAYMFIIDTGERRILHTGDFRLHGKRGNATLKMLSVYAKNIDYIICEGTMLSRTGESPMSEYELQQKAAKMMKSSKYVFVLCSSTHIDRIGAFYHANPEGRLFVCDEYQKSQLDTVRADHAGKSSFYDFVGIKTYAKNLDVYMEKKGFCMIIRATPYFSPILEKYKGRSLLVYSMWTGYLDDHARNNDLCNFLSPYEYRILHTSGHATPDDLKLVYDAVNPKRGLIPIHTESHEMFNEVIPYGKIIYLKDGEKFII